MITASRSIDWVTTPALKLTGQSIRKVIERFTLFTEKVILI